VLLTPGYYVITANVEPSGFDAHQENNSSSRGIMAALAQIHLPMVSRFGSW
jgi:hypothetical protein